MGRRSTSSTKSGKFMNPTDQARKEARKRELKKNKKQRMMVRAAVLKMKDPRQIIRDMEKLDEMEFNPVQQPLLNEKVLRDKRKKLRETFERIVRLYERENPTCTRSCVNWSWITRAKSPHSHPVPCCLLCPASPSASRKEAPWPPPGPPPPQILALYGIPARRVYGSDADLPIPGLERQAPAMDSGSDSERGSGSDSGEDSEDEQDKAGDERRPEDEAGGDRHAGRRIRFADMPPDASQEGKQPKKKRLVKKTKAITLCQSIPEEDEEEEVEEEYTDDSEGSDTEDRGPPGDTQAPLMPQRLPPPAVQPAHMQGPPMTGPPPLGPPPAPPMRPPGPPSGPPPGPPPGAPPFMRPPGMPAGMRGPVPPRMLPQDLLQADHRAPTRPSSWSPSWPPPRGPPPRLPPPAPLVSTYFTLGHKSDSKSKVLSNRIKSMPPPPPRAGGPGPGPGPAPAPMAPPMSMFPPPLNTNVLSAPPSIVPRQKAPGSVGQDTAQNSMPMRPGGMQMPPPPGTAGATIEKRANITAAAGGAAATISAKPQIINPKAEVTRFVPTALRVRRDKMGPGAGAGPVDKGLGVMGLRRDELMGGVHGHGHGHGHGHKHHAPAASMVHPSQVSTVAQPNMKTKDQVYEAFMREMEGLL
ncbi:hypothetical protein WMY93_002383 [Mugilogobius chulae]|uniref:Wbp11/ELF5/Saf1 N-terminal domain-containing protein n=1 Tax=Mugilogobius chulae TaxID=88201 RepID=A0AAW0Q4B7_9GOBI